MRKIAYCLGLPWWLRPGFSPWVGEIPWRRKWQPHSSALAWRILWTEEPVGYSPWGCKESGMTEQVTLSLSLAEVPKRIVGKIRRGTVMCGSEKEAQSHKRLGLQIG